MEVTDLAAQVRKEQKKGPARRLRQKGFIPAVFYGRSAENILLAVKNDDLVKLHKGKKDHAFIKLIIDDGGKKKIENLSLIKELQVQPLTGKFYHADFYEVDMKTKLTFEVSLQFAGKAIGCRKWWRIATYQTRCKSFLFAGKSSRSYWSRRQFPRYRDSIKIKELKLADGITVLDPADAAVVAVAAIKVVKATPAEEEAAAAAAADAVAAAEAAPAAEEKAEKEKGK